MKEEPRNTLEVAEGRVKCEPDDAADVKADVELSKSGGKSSSCGGGIVNKKEQSSSATSIKKEHETTTMTATTTTTTSTTYSQGSVHGSNSKPKESKHRSRDAAKELDVKRRKHDATLSSQVCIFYLVSTDERMHLLGNVSFLLRISSLLADVYGRDTKDQW